MVLSVEHILASGLESDVLPAQTAFVAAVVARFEAGGNGCTAMSQPCQLTSKPQRLGAPLTINFRKPSAMAVMGPQHMIRVLEPALQSRLSTHLHALVQGH